MKRIISFLLVLAMMLPGAMALAEGEAKQNINIEYGDIWVQSIVEYDGKLCVVSPEKISEIKLDEEKFVELKRVSHNEDTGYPNKFFMVDGKLYAMCEEKRICTVGEKDGALMPTEILGEISLKQNYGPSWDCNIIAMGKSIYFSLENHEGENGKGMVVEYNLETKKTREILKDMSGEIASYKDGKLLFSYSDMKKAEKNKSAGVNIIYSLDVESGKLEEIHSFKSQMKYEAQPVFYHSASDSIYYIEAGEVRKIKDKSNSELVAKVPHNSKCPFVMADGRIICRSQSQNKIAVRKLDPKLIPEKELVILNGEYQRDISKAESKIANLALSFKRLDWGKPEEMAQSIIAAKDSWDIMLINSESIDVESLVKKGYVEPISSEKVKESLSKMWEPYTQGCYFDGKPYAVPIQNYVEGMFYAKDIFKKLNIEAPKTIGDLLDLRYKFEKNQIPGADKYKLIEDDYIFSNVYWLFRSYVNEMMFANKDLSFDTPEFKALMEKMLRNNKEIKKIENGDGYSEESEYDERPALIVSHYVSDPYSYKHWIRDEENTDSDRKLGKLEQLKLSSVEGLEPVLFVSGICLVVNSQSKNKELAMELIEKILEGMEETKKAKFYKDWSEAVLNPRFEKVKADIDHERELVLKKLGEAKTDAEKKAIEQDNQWVLKYYEETLEREKYSIPKEAIEAYQKVMSENNFRLMTTKDRAYYSDSVITKDIHKRFENNQINLMQFINEIEGKIKIIKLERKK